MKGFHNTLTLIGRVLIALVLLLSACEMIVHWEATLQRLSSLGLTHVEIWAFSALVFEVLGSLCILLGWNARIGATLVILYLIPMTCLTFTIAAFISTDYSVQVAEFTRTLSALGGVCYIAVYGPGDYSLSK